MSDMATDDVAVSPTARRNARLYLVGLGASLTGDSAMTLVAAIWVKTLTGSSAAAAVVGVCLYALSLLGPLAGMAADRVRRQPFLVAVNVASAAALLPLLIVDRYHAVWVVYAVMAAYGISLVLIDPAESALFAVMLPPQLRQRVNGIRLTLQEGGKLVAPLLGAGLFTVLGGGTVAALDAATFLIAAAVTSRLRVDEPPPTPQGEPWRAELAAGFAFIRRSADLRTTVAAAAAAMAVSGVAVAAQFSLVDALGQRPAFLGVLTGLLGAGSVAAGLTSSRVLRAHGEHRLILLGLLNGTLGYVLYATGWLPAALIGAFVFGFALPWTVVAAINLVQRRAPTALQGRCAAALTFGLFAPQPVAQLLGAAVINHISYRIVYVLAAAATLATAGYTALHDHSPEDHAVPGAGACGHTSKP